MHVAPSDILEMAIVHVFGHLGHLWSVINGLVPITFTLDEKKHYETTFAVSMPLIVFIDTISIHKQENILKRLDGLYQTARYFLLA